MIIAVDFDGTIVEHKYPEIGRELPFAIETLKKLQQERHRLILWSVREGKLLQEAVDFCRERGLEFYAVMEKAERIYVLPAEFGWSDLGSWGSLHSLLPKDERNNAVVGENVRLYECNNCIVHTPHLKQAVIQGLDGYIIAEKEGTLLICKLAEEQRIKEFSKA